MMFKMSRQDDAAWVVVPSTPQQLDTAARAARRLVKKRAAMAAGVAVLPVPGLDAGLALDAAWPAAPSAAPAANPPGTAASPGLPPGGAV